MRAVIGLVVAVLLTILVSDGAQYVVSANAPAVAGMGAAEVRPAAILLGWILGTFVGALVGDLIARAVWPGYSIAVLMLAVVIFTVWQGDQPAWLGIGGLAGPLLAAFLAARVAAPRIDAARAEPDAR